jgi:hypothetical protein
MPTEFCDLYLYMYPPPPYTPACIYRASASDGTPRELLMQPRNIKAYNAEQLGQEVKPPAKDDQPLHAAGRKCGLHCEQLEQHRMDLPAHGPACMCLRYCLLSQTPAHTLASSRSASMSAAAYSILWPCFTFVAVQVIFTAQ